MNMYEPDAYYRPRKTHYGIVKFIGTIILALLIIDVLGAIAWIASGQQPQGTFYIGTITIHLLRLIVR